MGWHGPDGPGIERLSDSEWEDLQNEKWARCETCGDDDFLVEDAIVIEGLTYCPGPCAGDAIATVWADELGGGVIR